MKPGNTTILVIEDDEDIRQNIEDILELNGFQFFGATNGQEGLNLARTKLPNLILCDLFMPVKNGHEVIRELQAETATSQIPVLVLTAQADFRKVYKQINLKSEDFIIKPFSESLLINTIKARLARAELR